MARRCDVIFTATPHGVAMELAEEILAGGAVLIDIGSDFRFRDAGAYETWYSRSTPNRNWLRKPSTGSLSSFGIGA